MRLAERAVTGVLLVVLSEHFELFRDHLAFGIVFQRFRLRPLHLGQRLLQRRVVGRGETPDQNGVNFGRRGQVLIRTVPPAELAQVVVVVVVSEHIGRELVLLPKFIDEPVGGLPRLGAGKLRGHNEPKPVGIGQRILLVRLCLHPGDGAEEIQSLRGRARCADAPRNNRHQEEDRPFSCSAHKSPFRFGEAFRPENRDFPRLKERLIFYIGRSGCND